MKVERRNRNGRRINYTTDEAAKILDIERNTLLELINQGKIRTSLAGDVLRISLFEIHRYIMEQANV